MAFADFVATWAFGMLAVLMLCLWIKGSRLAAFAVRAVICLPLGVCLIAARFGVTSYMHDTAPLVVLEEIVLFAVAWMITGIPTYWRQFQERRSWHDDLFDLYGLDPEPPRQQPTVLEPQRLS